MTMPSFDCTYENSVLEGEISVANYEKLKRELQRIMDEEEGSVIFSPSERKNILIENC
jgi:CRISPR-associated protein Cas2